jgi:glutathione S-transferase
LAHWIDDCHPPSTGPLFPPDRLLRFVAQLIDEAFDEFGLYMVHHNRWKVAALGNDPGRRLASEMAKIIPPGAGSLYAQWFGRRQVRRLPYLFSVAPEGYRVAGLSPAMTPPSLPDFPPTHDLLEIAWRACLAATEAILGEQRFLLGDRFTVADASVYGQLSMNLTDLAADGLMRELAPRTHEWLCGIRDGAHVNSQGPLFLGDNLSALLDIIGGTFISLMRQNANAYEENRARGETLFNEAAFDRGRSLYFGELLGRPYRAVVKTFQVRVWNDLLSAWQSLQPGERQQLLSVSDALADFG